MENDKNVFDVEFQDVENEICLTAPQLAQRIKDTDTRVRHWADVFGDLIGIEKLNGRKRYKESDVYKFAFIKDMIDNKNMKHDQIKVYLSKHGFKYAEFNSGLVDIKDPLGFQALASALSVEVSNKLNQFADELLTNVNNQLNEYLIKQQYLNMETKAEIESSVEQIVDNKLSEVSEKQQQHSEELKEFVAITIQNEVKENIGSQIDNLKSHIDLKEQEAQKYETEKINELREHLEQRRKENEQKEQEKNQHKGFFSKIFKSKK